MRSPQAAALTTLVLLAGLGGAIAQQPVVTEFMASNGGTFTDGEGNNPDWIEIYNPSASAVSLVGWHLTDNANNLTKWIFPASAAASIPAGGFLLVMASGNATSSAAYLDASGYLHTSFRLDAQGEDVLLVAPDGTTIVSGFHDYPEQTRDISYGRGSNGVDGYFATATPGAANGPAAAGFVADTRFSVRRGFFTDPFAVEITCATPGATIKYTLDASTPSATNGLVYSGPIPITRTTVLRATALRDGWFPTDVDTQTYLFLADIVAQPATKPSAAWPDPFVPSGPGSTRQAIDYGMDARITGHATYGPLMLGALRAVPSIFVTTDLPNLFDATTGIYSNPAGDGIEWERPAAVEMLHGDGTEAFHVNAGLRIRGGVSRSTRNPKHSFRIVMRNEYGDSRIEYPLFGDEGASSFDKIDFRTAQNFSWNFSNAAFASWLDDPFSRDTMRDLGHPYTRGFFFHLYLNGVYWGLFQTEERADSHFARSYLGGNRDDFDVLKSDNDDGHLYAVDGTTDFYFALWSIVNAGVATAADYFRIQGRNTDGTPNPQYPRYLDADNLIDYMLIVFFTGATDMPIGPPFSNRMPRNLYAMVNRAEPDGIKWLPHDNEHSLSRQSGISLNRVNVSLPSQLALQTNFNPWWLHTRLQTNPEYAIAFADRVRKHFFHGGAFTPEACTARYQARVAEIELAIVAESARWGDWLTPTSPRTRDVDWRTNVNWVLNSFFNATPSSRTTVVLGQLRNAGLYPAVDAPEFNQHGGVVPAGFQAVATAPSGTIHYTLDGTDPRAVGGAVATGVLSGASGLAIPITHTTTIKARARNGTTWSALTEVTFAVAAPPVRDSWQIR
ncbi:MAG: CotH kinase family protein [Candidatus Sumerlaeia bacterium]|nr:CotH kinase family protein [Candidatus Sumerlaeia bacterium]